MQDGERQPEATGELIQYQGRLHWTIIVRPVMLTCLALFSFNASVPLLGVLFGLVAVLFWLAALFSLRSPALVITDQRVRLSNGTVYRVSVDVPLEAIDRINLSQDFMGRMLGYGTLVVETHSGSVARCPNLARPDESRSQLERVVGVSG